MPPGPWVEGTVSVAAAYGGDGNFTTSTSAGLDQTVNYPVPVLTGLAPASAEENTPGTSVIVQGSNFFSTSVVQKDGTALATSYGGPTSLTATLTPADLAEEHAWSI